MTMPFHERLAELKQAWRKSDYAGADAAITDLLSQCKNSVALLETWARFDIDAGDLIAAESKFRVLGLLVPGDDWPKRDLAYVQALRGNVEDSLALLAPAAANPRDSNEFIFLVESYLRLLETHRASALVAKYADSGRFPASDILAAEGCIALNLGRLTEAERLSRQAAMMDPPSSQGLRQIAIIAEHRAQPSNSGDAWGKVADIGGSEDALRRAVAQYLFLFDFDKALDVIARVATKWPRLAGAAAALEGETAALREACAEALRDCGPLTPVDRARLLNALTGAVSPNELLWGKQALVVLVHSSEFTEDDAATLLSLTLVNWEDRRVRALILQQGAQNFPDAVALRWSQLQFLFSASATLWRDGSAVLFGIPEDHWDENIIFIALHLLTYLETDEQGIANDNEAEALRRKLAGALPRVHAAFATVAARRLASLGLTAPPLSGLPSEAELRHALHSSAGFVNAPWRPAMPVLHIAGPRQPDVVVGISGQVRGFARAWSTIAEKLVKPLGAPVIMSVWDTTRNARGRHAARLARVLPPDILNTLPAEAQFDDVFEKRYPATAALLFGVQPVDAGALRSIIARSEVRHSYVETEAEGIFDATINPHMNLDKNLMKMFAKMTRLEELIREEEVRRDHIFTHVLWVRPDVEILQKITSQLDRWLADNRMAWSTFCSPWVFMDHMFLVPRRGFETIGKIFGNLVTGNSMSFLGWRPARSANKQEDPRNQMLMGPETLSDSLFAAGFATRGMQGVTYRLVGSAPPGQEIREMFLRESAAHS